MVNCAMINCHNKSTKGMPGVRFFNIPKVITTQCSLTRSRTERRRALWLSRINRKDLQDADVKPQTRVCSKHFISDSPSVLYDECNPDWAPSQELGYTPSKPVNSTASARHARSKRRAVVKSSPTMKPLSPVRPPAPRDLCQNEEVLDDADENLELALEAQRQPEDSVADVEVVPPENVDDTPNQEIESADCDKTPVQDDDGHLLDAAPVNVCDSVPKSDHEAIQKELSDLNKQYIAACERAKNLRDQLTNRDVDVLELQASLKTAEATVKSMKKRMEEQEKAFDVKMKMAEERVSQQYEARLQENLERIEELREEVRQAEELTFKKLESFASNERKVRFYTGLPSFGVFKVVLDGVVSYMEEQSVDLSRFLLEPWQSLLVTLMRLRLNLTHEDLAYRFGVSKATICRTFDKWIDALCNSVYPAMVKWPDRETLWETMPREFREQYGNSVAVIIDCFEIFTEKPSSLDTRASVWSNYKHHHTVKFLIGISPTGAVIFVSSGWGARASDQHVVKESGLYDLLLPHDVVMADRGFKIAEHLALYGAKLLIPAFTRGQDQLSSHDVSLTRKIANLRIHVERVIGLVRNKYRILKSILPIEMLSKKENDEFSPIDKIVRVCCALINLCPSIVVHADIHEQMSDDGEDL